MLKQKLSHQPAACICPLLCILMPVSLPRASICAGPSNEEPLHHHLLQCHFCCSHQVDSSSLQTYGVNYSMAFCQDRIPGHLLLSYKLFSKLSYFDCLSTERSKLPGRHCSGRDKMVLSGASLPVVTVISRGIPPPYALFARGDHVACYSR